MKKFKVKRDGERDLSFTGELIATAETSPNNARSDYSGSVGQWTELELYRTAAGKYICSRAEKTQWQGSNHSYEAAAAGTHAEVVEFFGLDDLAKELYQGAEIDADEQVE